MKKLVKTAQRLNNKCFVMGKNTTELVCPLVDFFPAADLLAPMGLIRFEVAYNSCPESFGTTLDQSMLAIVRATAVELCLVIVVRAIYLDGTLLEAPLCIQSKCSA